MRFRKMGGARLPIKCKMAWCTLLVLLCWAVVSRATHCNVKDYGAKGDGKNNDTEAFIKAFEACAVPGKPSTVYVPPGSYSVWPLVFEETKCTNLIFNVTGELLAPSDPAGFKWVANESYLLFKDCQNFSLNGWGMGSINGQGKEWWDLYKDQERPRLVILDNCSHVSVQNIHLMDSPMFHLVPTRSEDVLIEGVTISAPENSPNTDGIDPSSSKLVLIRNCVIGTGDDNVAVKPGCDNITVEDCLFQSGHGCSIGSINTTGVQNVLMKNITFVGTENGARIKTWQGGSGLVENIQYIGLKMEGVGLPIKIDMYYCPDGGCHNHTQGVTIKNILFSNMTGTQTSGQAGELYCSDTVPCTHIVMENIDIQSHDQSTGNEFKCWRAFGEAANVKPTPCLLPGP